jgi:hypothetical protein
MERVYMPKDVNQDVVSYPRTLATSCPGLAPSQVIIEEPAQPRMDRGDFWVTVVSGVILVGVVGCMLAGVI